MEIMKFIIVGVAVSLLSNCANENYVDIQTSEIKHSSPEVISLFEIENQKQKRQENSGGFFSRLLEGMIDGLFASSPDAYDDYGSDRRGNSDRDKKEFVSKNEDKLRDSLESKKR